MGTRSGAGWAVVGEQDSDPGQCPGRYHQNGTGPRPPQIQRVGRREPAQVHQHDRQIDTAPACLLVIEGRRRVGHHIRRTDMSLAADGNPLMVIPVPRGLSVVRGGRFDAQAATSLPVIRVRAPFSQAVH